MILPNKYEPLTSNALIIGAAIVKILLPVKEIEVLKLYNKLDSGISIINFFDVLTFLFTLDIISLNNNKIKLKNVPK